MSDITEPTSQEVQDIDEILELLTDLEKKYCQITVLQKPKSKSEALKRAGSKADAKYRSKMAWEIEQRDHVKLYMDHLQNMVVKEAGLNIQEIINNCRKAIELGFMNGKPKDIEPHNRLLAELGGFIKGAGSGTSGGAITNNTQNNIKIASDIREDDATLDFNRLRDIAELKPIGDIDMITMEKEIT